MLKKLSKVLCVVAAMAVAMPTFAQLKVADPSKPIEGVIRVKLQPETARKIGSVKRISPRGKLSTGTALDAPLKAIKGVSIRPVFTPNPKFAAQRAKFGLDQWYEIEFDGNMTSNEAAVALRQTAGVSKAQVRYPMVLFDGDATVVKAEPSKAVAQTSEMPFNDPRLDQQWHYNNNGQRAGWVAGADINLFEAWKTETGKSNVVVAIIDGGIDYTHDDLAANMWVNEAELNGKPGVDDDNNKYTDDIYGYNFVSNEARIYPHDHGTHVAGTVAAVNNNGIGVAGVAGGNGEAGSGVRLMSCQVFDSRTGLPEGNFADALVYAAENGASIAQCSWGWASPGYCDEAVVKAIRYFNESAKSDCMKGGLCIFAAGNESSTGELYPGCLPEVLTVGAMTAQLTAAPYTNYGPWVNVVAPGGFLDYDQQEGILSTLPNNSYGFMDGTSMACPHVSGIAALVLSKHGNANFLASTLRTQLETSVRDFYTKNPTWVGLLGTGYIDAARALNIGDGSAPSAVAEYEASPAQDQIIFSWTIPASSDGNVNHHVIYYSTTEFNAQSNLSEIPSVVVDTRFLASGDPMTYELCDLKAMTSYWVAIQAVNRLGKASELSEVKKVTTNAGPKLELTAGTAEKNITVSPSETTAGSFTIGNTAEGLLKWETSLRTVSALPKGRMQSQPYHGTVGLAKAPAPAKSVVTYDAESYMASDYPKRMQSYEALQAYIGDTDKSKPNALAQLFTVDAQKYPNGFNLTHVRFEGKNGKDATIEIYRGNTMFTEQNLELRFEPEHFGYNYNLKFPEQIWFAPGESFWIVAHFVSDELYPLGLGLKNDSPTALSAYLSNDGGKTWTILAEALKGSSFESIASKATWCVQAISMNPDWSQVLTVEPASGQLKQNETQKVEVKHNGTPIVNGTYKVKVNVKTNETTPSAKNYVEMNLKVSGNKPEIAINKVIDFGNLLVGQKKTIQVEILNSGYGKFGATETSSDLSSKNIKSTDINFKAPTYISGGFPARSVSTIELTYEPTEEGSHSGQIVFTGTGEFKIMVVGTATMPAKIAIDPTELDAGELVAGEQPKELEFTIENKGIFPLEFVFPNYSDQTLSSATGESTVHRFGYTVDNSITGTVAYEPMPTLTDGKDVTSQFNDQTNWSEPIEIGFEFPYYGKNYSSLYISKFGGVAFNYEPDVNMYGPLAPGANGVAGTGLISAFGLCDLAMGPQSNVTYGHKDGKFVVNFENVLAVVYDKERTPISFHMSLSPTGDVYVAYDNYNPQKVIRQGKELFLALNDMEEVDPLIVTSWEMVRDEVTDLYTKIVSGTAFQFYAPAPNIVSAISPAYGMLAPNDKVLVKATVEATAEMSAGPTQTNVVINCNDPEKASSLIRFNATIGGDLKPELTVKTTDLDFGKVFRTSTSVLNVTVSNSGRNDLTLTDATLAENKFVLDFKKGAVIPARQSLDIVVTLPTEQEGAVSDVLTITTDAGTASVNLSGEVIGVPEATLSYTSVEETLPYGESKKIPLTITNNGNEPLEWSLTSGAHLSYVPQYADDAKVDYLYSSSVDDKAVDKSWVDIVTDGDASTEHHDMTYLLNNDYFEVELPFEFPFYGKKYTKMYVYGAGFVSFTERTDEHVTPEPPGDFPQGSIYDNLIAPYWGLHFPVENRTSGIYTRGDEQEMVVSFMEYGNTMNYGVDYQLIMHPDGTFRFVYKGHDGNAQIFNIFGVAGTSNEGATSGVRLAERMVVLGQAVQFTPVVVSTIAAGESTTADVTLLADAMGGQYESALTLNTNVPTKPTVEIPVSLTIEGTPKPEIPEKVDLEFIVGSASTDMSDPLVQMGMTVLQNNIAQVKHFTIGNSGSASFTAQILGVELPVVEDENGGMPAYMFAYYGPNPMGGGFGPEPLADEAVNEEKMWNIYMPGMPIPPIEVDREGFECAIVVPAGYPAHVAPGEYLGNLYLQIAGQEEPVVVPLNVITTPPPYIHYDKTELTHTGVAKDFKTEDVITLTNMGLYKLTYDFYIDTTGKGEEPAEQQPGGGINPLANSAETVEAVEAVELLSTSVNSGIVTHDTEPSDDYLNTPQGEEAAKYTNQLYYPAQVGTKTMYTYGSGKEYADFYGSTLFESPKGGFNISHIYTCIAPGEFENVDYEVEIRLGDDPSSGVVAGRGTFHLDVSPYKGDKDSDRGTLFITIPLDHPVFVGEGSSFCVVVKYPVGAGVVAGLLPKADGIVSNRYMASTDNIRWFDVASRHEDKGSLGFATTCLQTTEGAFWASLEPDATTAGELQPEESTAIKIKIDAAAAPLENENKAMLVIHSNDITQPIVNIPIVLSKNAKPVISTETTTLEANEGEECKFVVQVDEAEGDAFTVTLTDDGNLITFESVDAGEATVTIADDKKSFSVAGSEDKKTPISAKATCVLDPYYGDAGEFTVSFSATDEPKNEGSLEVNYIVNHTNRVPEANTVNDVVLSVGQTSAMVAFESMFTDPDGDPLTYTLDVVDTNGVVEPYLSNNGVIFYGNKEGQATATVTATDSEGGKTSVSFTVTVDKGSGISDVQANAEGITVAPTVTTDVVTLTCSFSDSALAVNVFAMNGQMVVAEQLAVSTGLPTDLSLGHLPTGNYLLVVTASDGSTANFRIIRE